MKSKIFLRRMFHRDKSRIGIHFSYNEFIKEKVRKLPSCAFSSTHKCFYIDDTEEALREALNSLREHAEVDISSLSLPSERKNMDKQTLPADSSRVASDSSVAAATGSSGADAEDEVYEMVSFSSEKENNDHIDDNEDHARVEVQKYDPVEFRISEKEGLLVLRFTGRYNRIWIDELKSYGRLRYDRRRKEFLLEWKKLTTDSLADYFSSSGVEVIVKKLAVDEGLKAERRVNGDEVRAKELGKSALDALETMAGFLDENRYSVRTREAYLSILEFYFRYFSPQDPDEISQEEVSRFIYDFIIRLGYSASYQNQVVSAIKTYYTISGRGRINPLIFERPRRSKTLPKVFSKEEVTAILTSARNQKHRLLLWTIYSCGLRRSEVTNIRLTDLDRERGVIHIREGKGRVDRIVPLASMVWQKVDEYLRSYKPHVYLFEGQKGGRYSSESVYNVFKQALGRAGIRKDVGVHCLRHSYATHLHEKGLDIRYIQELLGHKSSRTTEIYTHVSRRNLVQVRSPIEDLDLE